MPRARRQHVEHTGIDGLRAPNSDRLCDAIQRSDGRAVQRYLVIDKRQRLSTCGSDKCADHLDQRNNNYDANNCGHLQLCGHLHGAERRQRQCERQPKRLRTNIRRADFRLFIDLNRKLYFPDVDIGAGDQLHGSGRLGGWTCQFWHAERKPDHSGNVYVHAHLHQPRGWHRYDVGGPDRLRTAHCHALIRLPVDHTRQLNDVNMVVHPGYCLQRVWHLDRGARYFRKPKHLSIGRGLVCLYRHMY